jgi:hypothetical protein
VQVRPVQVRPVQVRPAQVRPAQVRPVQVRPAQVRPAQVRPAQVRPAQVRPVQVRPTQVRLAKTKNNLPINILNIHFFTPFYKLLKLKFAGLKNHLNIVFVKWLPNKRSRYQLETLVLFQVILYLVKTGEKGVLSKPTKCFFFCPCNKWMKNFVTWSTKVCVTN